MTKDGRLRATRGRSAAASVALAAVLSTLVAAQGSPAAHPTPAVAAPAGDPRAAATPDRTVDEAADRAAHRPDPRAAAPVGDDTSHDPAHHETAHHETAHDPAHAETHHETAHAETVHAETAEPGHETHGAPDDHADTPADPAPAVPVDPAAPSAPAPAAPAAAPAEAPAEAPATTPAAVAPVAPGVVTGTLTRAWAERHVEPHSDLDEVHTAQGEHAGEEPELLAWVETVEAAYPVSLADLREVEDGSTVTVDLAAATAAGTHPATVLAVEPPVAAAGEVLYGEGSDDVFGIASASVVHDVTVVLAVPAGAATDSMTTATVVNAVNGGVNSFWTDQSRGQRGFRVTAAHGWYRLTSTCSNPIGLWNEVASKVGFVSGTRKHLLVYIPPAAGCGAGLGTVGSPDSGGRSWVNQASTSIIAHELGHNLGLGHSNGLLCSSTADGAFSGGTWQPGCTVYDYRDYYDVMGVSWANLGSLAAPQADALGLLRSTEKLTATTPVRVRLVPASSDGLRVLRVDDPGGTYYVEYRTPTGWDGWLANNYRGLDAGVLVHRTSPAKAREVLVLDGSVTAGTRTDDWRSALGQGGSFTTSSGSTKVVVEQADAGGATLVVYRDGVGPAAVKPPAGGAQVDIQSPTGGVRAGTVTISGVATAPEGTLMWDVRQNGDRKAYGYAQTGANGVFDTFSIPVALPAGSFTVRTWVPDESSGERPSGAVGFSDQISLTVS